MLLNADKNIHYNLLKMLLKLVLILIKSQVKAKELSLCHKLKFANSYIL